MIKIKKYNIKKLLSVFRKIPRAIAEHFFSAVFLFLLVVLVLGGLIFYQYNFSIQNKDIEVSLDVLKFKEDVYQKILVIWSEREKRFSESDGKIYLNPFKAPIKEELTK